MKWLREGTRCFSFSVIAAVIAFLVLSSVFAQKSMAAAMTMVADKHKEIGFDCGACHKESPPKNAVPASACVDCHGDAAAMAEITAKKNPNPHATKEPNCASCHKAHK